MARLLLTLCFTISVAVYGQIQTSALDALVNKKQLYSIDDTVISVTSGKTERSGLPVAIFINGVFQNVLLEGGIDKEKIERIMVIHDTIELNNNHYYGRVMIDLKDGYLPKFISVSDLVFKHTNLDRIPDIVMLDDEIISCDISECTVDAYYILKIDVREILSASDGDSISIVRLMTRTEENVKQANTVYIRGHNEMLK